MRSTPGALRHRESDHSPAAAVEEQARRNPPAAPPALTEAPPARNKTATRAHQSGTNRAFEARRPPPPPSVASVPIPPDSLRRLLPPLGAALLLWAGWVAPFAAPAAVAAPGRWLRPVPGETARPFAYGSNPFARGQHRGADLSAPPGARVRSACAGVVVFAGRVPGHGRGVSVRCGRHRVTYLPLMATAVRRGAPVAAGSALGRVAAGHGGALHLGVRWEGRRFGYVDPEPLLGDDPVPPVAVRVPRLGPAPRPRPAPPFPRPAPAPPVPVAVPVAGVAPWPVWLGLALVLTGAAGGRTLALRRARRRAAPSPAVARR